MNFPPSLIHLRRNNITSENVKPVPRINRNSRKHAFANMYFLKAVQIWVGPHVVAIIISIDLSQKKNCNRYVDSYKVLFKAASQASWMSCDGYDYEESWLYSTFACKRTFLLQFLFYISKDIPAKLHIFMTLL